MLFTGTAPGYERGRVGGKSGRGREGVTKVVTVAVSPPGMVIGVQSGSAKWE